MPHRGLDFTRWRDSHAHEQQISYQPQPHPLRFCGEPFPLRDGYVEFWRASSGHHFCSEFCADDAEEAQFVKSHVTEAVGTSSVNGSTPL